MQFVWLYVHGPDNGFELRHSIRSVIQNFDGEAKVMVIGDKPDWYTGPYIHVDRMRRRGVPQRAAFLDTQNKIVIASNHPEIDDEFVWIMDDVYLINRTTTGDLSVPRYDPWYQSGRTEWHRRISATFQALRSKGRPNMQAGTHLPHVFRKQKLVECFREYDYPRHLYLFEILYFNHYNDTAIPYGENLNGVQYPQFLRRLLKRPRREADLDATAFHSNVLNYQSTCLCNVMKKWLQKRFPVKSEFEA